tara:strand:- start:914 stop:1882 length:969 start_codon:yes stop_codon:yes gene_type:complete
MKAVRFHEFGGPEVLKYEETETPVILNGELLVKVGASGVNFIDTYQRTGAYKVELPHIAGQEAAGEVIGVSDDVNGFDVGDHVAFTGTPFAYAEYMKVPAEKAVKLPPGVSDQEGAAILLQGMTAHYLANSTYPLQKGQTCLIHAAAGGVGLLLVQIAKMLGAQVIGTVSTEEKAELARSVGADEIILYTEKDFTSEVKRITDGEGLPVVFDSVGKTTFEGSLNCLGHRGYMVLYGQSSGRVDPVDPQILNAKGSLFLTRPSLNSYALSREEIEWRANDLFSWVESGKMKIHIDGVFHLSEAGEAHTRLEGRKTTGKVVLTP